MTCPGRLALCGIPCGCNGRQPSHYPRIKPGDVDLSAGRVQFVIEPKYLIPKAWTELR